jgi:hypothetical protein
MPISTLPVSNNPTAHKDLSAGNISNEENEPKLIKNINSNQTASSNLNNRKKSQ